MRRTNDDRSSPKNFFATPVFATIAFVVAIVALLIVINRSEYFQLRPASGSAHAISEAAHAPAADAAKQP